MIVRVRAPSRLHFGFLSLPGEEEPSNTCDQVRLPARRFGGAGLMIQDPGLELTVEPAPAWSAHGRLAERALEFAKRFAGSLPHGAVVPHLIRVEHAPPEHVGLGTGTQLGMTTAQALATASSLIMNATDLARRIGRGARSGLGVHGFAQGGFLIDGGKREGQGVAPLVARAVFPEEWRIVLIIPPWGQGLHGEGEKAAFHSLVCQHFSATLTDTLCRLALLGMLPALIEHDWRVFGEVIYEFNARVGEAFKPVQNGIYADPRIAELISFIRRQGIPGSGQSSWGPTVFALADDDSRAAALANCIRNQFGLSAQAIVCTKACNQGADSTFDPGR